MLIANTPENLLLLLSSGTVVSEREESASIDYWLSITCPSLNVLIFLTAIMMISWALLTRGVYASVILCQGNENHPCDFRLDYDAIMNDEWHVCLTWRLVIFTTTTSYHKVMALSNQRNTISVTTQLLALLKVIQSWISFRRNYTAKSDLTRSVTPLCNFKLSLLTDIEMQFL